MDIKNLQLNTIINSFQEKNTHLVYNKDDHCFYTFGSTDVFKKNNHINAIATQEKIKEFIFNNRSFLNSNLLTKFNDQLEIQIKYVTNRTSGFWSFFRFLFNFDSKKSLIKKRDWMLEMTDIVKKALEFQKVENQKKITFDVKIEIPEPVKMTLSQPLNSSDNVPMVPVGGPPPPPGLNSGINLIQEVKLLNEPQELNFSATDYKKLSDDKIREQIEKINTYVTGLKAVLLPVDDRLKQIKKLQNQISEKQNKLNILNSEIDKYTSHYHAFEKATKENKVVYLDYQQGQATRQLPFFPDDIYDELLKKLKEFEQIHQKEIVKLTQKVESKKKQMSQTTDLTVLEKEKEELTQVENELKSMRANPPFPTKSLSPQLKLSEATVQIKKILDYITNKLNERKKSLDQLTEELTKLNGESFQGLAFEKLEEIYKSKTLILEKWVRNLRSREQWLKRRMGSTKVSFVKGNTDRYSALVQQIPVLSLLINIPRKVDLALSLKKMREAPIEEYDKSIFAMLRSCTTA